MLEVLRNDALGRRGCNFHTHSYVLLWHNATLSWYKILSLWQHVEPGKEGGKGDFKRNFTFLFNFRKMVLLPHTYSGLHRFKNLNKSAVSLFVYFPFNTRLSFGSNTHAIYDQNAFKANLWYLKRTCFI